LVSEFINERFSLQVAMPGPLTRVCLIQLPLFALASWTLLSENDGPSPRFAHTAALGTNQALWVHAGKGDERFLDDLWVYNNLLDVWTLVGLLTVPAARKAHVAVTDPAGDLWIHGGQDGQTFFQDLWKLSANTWTLVSNSSVPARSGHIAVWDSRNRAIWIHGGFDGALRQDLWKFDTESSNWFSVDSSYQPSARAYHVAALDEVNQELWVHGGYDGGEPWTECSAPSLGPTMCHSMSEEFFLLNEFKVLSKSR